MTADYEAALVELRRQIKQVADGLEQRAWNIEHVPERMGGTGHDKDAPVFFEDIYGPTEGTVLELRLVVELLRLALDGGLPRSERP